MALAEWDESYSVGIKSFDDQHKKIFAYINELFTGIKSGHSQETLDEVITGLEEYTRSHFSGEEAVMEQHSYPNLAEHKIEHLEFINKILEVSETYGDNGMENADRLLIFLIDWLRNHIAETDSKYTEYLTSRGVI